MPKLIDLTGQKFGELTVLGRDLEYPKINNIKKKSETYWKVQCSCGNIFTKSRTVLKNGKWLACSNCNTKNKIKRIITETIRPSSSTTIAKIKSV